MLMLMLRRRQGRRLGCRRKVVAALVDRREVRHPHRRRRAQVARPRGAPAFGFFATLALPLPGFPTAPALDFAAAAIRVLAFRPVVGRASPNGARAEPWPAFSSPSA